MRLTSELFDELAMKEGLTFTDKEKKELMEELNSMIRFVDKIKNVNTDGVEELTEMPPVSACCAENENSFSR